MSCRELAAEELAGGVARQRRREADAARHLESGEALAAEGNELFTCRRGVGAKDDYRGRRPAPALVGQRVDARLEHGGVGGEDGLDLRRVDVFAAGDDQVVAAVEDVEVAFGVEVADVAGEQPAVAQGGGRLFRPVQVAGRDRRPADEDIACLAGRAVGAVVADDAQLGTE